MLVSRFLTKMFLVFAFLFILVITINPARPDTVIPPQDKYFFTKQIEDWTVVGRKDDGNCVAFRRDDVSTFFAIIPNTKQLYLSFASISWKIPGEIGSTLPVSLSFVVGSDSVTKQFEFVVVSDKIFATTPVPVSIIRLMTISHTMIGNGPGFNFDLDTRPIPHVLNGLVECTTNKTPTLNMSN